MSSTAYDRVISALEAHGATRKGRDWSCPAHDDSKPSLSVAQGAKGGAVLKCQAGCETAAVVAALGLTMASLFDERATPIYHTEAIYPYVDEDGTLLFEVERRRPKDFLQRRPDGRGGFIYKLDDTRRVPFRLPAVIAAARAGDDVYIPEGEKDCLAIEAAGGTASCNPAGAGKWRDEFSPHFRGAVVTVVADKDGPGRAHAAQVAASLHSHGVESVRIVEAATGKDAHDHLAAGHSLADFLPVGSDDAASDGAFEGWLESAVEWAARAEDSPRQIVQGIPVGGLAVVASFPKCGKTWLLYLLALCVASGRNWFGRYPIEQPGRVLLILTEGSHAGAVVRLTALALGLDIDLPTVFGRIDVVWRRGLQLDDPAAVDWLVEMAPNYTLVVIDLLRDAWSGNENHAADWQPIIRSLQRVTDQGPTVAVSAHIAKPNDNNKGLAAGMRIRGSNTPYGAADSVVALERDAESRDVRVIFESRDDLPLEPFVFTLPGERVDGTKALELLAQDTEVKRLELDDILRMRIVELVEGSPGLSRTAVARAAGGRKQRALEVIEDLLHRHVLYEPNGVRRGLRSTATDPFLTTVPETPEPSGTLGTNGSVGNPPLRSRGGAGTVVGNRSQTVPGVVA